MAMTQMGEDNEGSPGGPRGVKWSWVKVEN